MVLKASLAGEFRVSIVFLQSYSFAFVLVCCPQDFGGTWYAYGFGANVFMTESLRLYGEFERTASGIVKTPYRWNVGARYVW